MQEPKLTILLRNISYARTETYNIHDKEPKTQINKQIQVGTIQQPHFGNTIACEAIANGTTC
jgi:hypothetical protein